MSGVIWVSCDRSTELINPTTLDNELSESLQSLKATGWKFEHPYLQKADSLQKIRSLDSAVLYYQKALQRFREEKDWEGYTTTSNRLAFNFITELGRLSEAQPLVDSAMWVAEKYLEASNPLVAETYFVNGVYHDWAGAPEQALYWQNMALEMRKKLLGENHPAIADSYYALAELQRFSLANIGLSGEYYQKALGIQSQSADTTSIKIAFCYFGLASINRSFGDYANALIYAEKALSIFQQWAQNQNHGAFKQYQISCIALMGNIYAAANFDQHQTEAFFLKATDLLEDQENVYPQLSNFYHNLGAFYLYHWKALNMEEENLSVPYKKDKKNFYLNKAKDIFWKALRVNRNNASADLDESYLLLGETYTALSMPDSARFYLQKSLDIRKQTSELSPVLESAVYIGLGDLYLSTDSIYQSVDSLFVGLEFYQKGLSLLVEDFYSEEFYQNPVFTVENYHPLLFNILFGKAGVFRQLYFRSLETKFLEEALLLYGFADNLNDLRRNSGIREESKLLLEANQLILEANQRSHIEKGIDCAYLLYHKSKDSKYIEQAFNFMEKRKYMLLLESLYKTEMVENSKIGIPDSILRKEKLLKTQMARLSIDLNSEKKQDTPDSIFIASMESQKFAVAQQQEALQEILSSYYPNYYQIHYDSLSIELTGITEPGESPGKLYIEYYWGGDAIYAVGVADHSLAFSKVSHPAALKQDIENILGIISHQPDFRDLNNQFDQFKSSALEVYEKLLEPTLNKTLSQKDQAISGIVVIPDGPLSYLPFEVLISDESDPGNDFKTANYLIKDHYITYAYSATLLKRNQINTAVKNRVLAFAHSDLSGGNDEVEAIGKIMDIKKFTESASTEENFKTYASSYDVIHLAVHGIVDQGADLQNKLIFTPSDISTEDGELNDYELYSLNLNANLVVLSACESGLGKQLEGEGVFSIARGFIYAGCPAAVMSLWQADDQTSAKIIVEFYNGLYHGLTIDQALRESKLQYLGAQDEITAHPWFWATFINVGDSTEMKFKKSSLQTWLGLILLTTALLAVIGAYSHWKGRSSR